jgi:ABC-type Zn2+ transport system substrate-binding protein/surface adhesin
MSGSLDTSFLMETIAKDDEVNLPPDVMDREIKKREAKAKKQAQEAVLVKKVKSLEKIEKKTERLLKKAKKREEKQEKTPAIHNKIPSKSVATHNTLERTPSMLDYHMLNRFPKAVMKFIWEKHKELEIDKDGLFVIDTEEMKDKLNKSANQIANTVLRLKGKGFIFIEKYNTCGTRAIRINLSLFQ